MTDFDRTWMLDEALHQAVSRIDTKEFPLFEQRCMQAVVGAALFLNRDPVQLSHDIRDRLGEILVAAEVTLPLELESPRSVQVPMEELLRETAAWMERERDILDRKLQRVLRTFDAAARASRRRADETRSWECCWSNIRSWFGYDENWRKYK